MKSLLVLFIGLLLAGCADTARVIDAGLRSYYSQPPQPTTTQP